MKQALKQIITLFSLIILLQISGYSQPKLTSDSRQIIKVVEQEYRNMNFNSASWKHIENNYPIYKMGNGLALAFLAKKNSAFNIAEINNMDVEIGSTIGDIITLRVPIQNIGMVMGYHGLSYLEVAARVTPMLDRVVFDTRVDSVHAGINLPQAYTGKNVIIGVTDWGFDYTSPMFYDTNLTQTRILAAWDQFKTSGPAPSGYSYGAEFNGAAELLLAETDTTNFYDHSTHGTHVAGIAGGGGAGTKYRGMAFESEFLFVTIKIDLAAILDAYTWMKGKADAEGKRLVINQSWGLYYLGTLDGNSLISQATDNLSSQGVVFTTSAGNNGNDNFHIMKDFNADTLKSAVTFYTYSDPSFWGQSLNMWGEQNHSFYAKAVLLDATNQFVAETPMFYTGTDTIYLDTNLVIGSDTLFYRFSADASHPLNQRPHMRFRINNKNTPYKVTMVAYADSGVVHFWNISEMAWGEGNWGQNFYSLGTGYTVGDHNYGISEPAVTNSIITVGAHNAEFRNTLGNIVGGAGTSFSSYGPTIDGRMKPDVSAPGGNVCSSISSYTTASYTQVYSVNFAGRDYPFAKFSGTSMSSPATAGVCALLLDADSSLTSQEVKDIIIQTAREDTYTGDIPDSGSTRWGHGKVNAHLAIATALNIVGIEQYESNNLLLYPNPCVSNIFIHWNENFGMQGNVIIYSAEGKRVKLLKNASLINPLDVSDLPSGLYLIRIISGNHQYNGRFVKGRL